MIDLQRALAPPASVWQHTEPSSVRTASPAGASHRDPVLDDHRGGSTDSPRAATCHADDTSRYPDWINFG